MKQTRKDYSDGSYFQGQMIGGSEHGAGTVMLTDGSLLKGTFTHGACTSATIEFGDKAEYRGDVRGLKPHGIGLLKSN